MTPMYPLASRGSVCGPLGASPASLATSWWLSGGISASDVAGAWAAKGAASLDASYLRLAGSEGYADIDPAVVGGVAPTWDAVNGWIFTKSLSTYLTTGIVPASGYAAFIRFNSLVIGHGAFFGEVTLPNSVLAIDIATTTMRGFYGSSSANVAAYTSGSVAITSDGLYKDGLYIAPSGTWSGTAGLQLHIGRYNYAYPQYSTINIGYISIYKSPLTGAQVAALHAATV